MSAELKRTKKALHYAILVIESYAFDIRCTGPDAEFWTEIPDLAKLGFCQGSIYKKAVEDIRKFEEGER